MMHRGSSPIQLINIPSAALIGFPPVPPQLCSLLALHHQLGPEAIAIEYALALP
jgi:hypothetical protein